MLKENRPGGPMGTRPLHFIWITDVSGSMSIDGKIETLNHAIDEAIPHMQQVAGENPNAEVLVRAVKFSDGASWHITTPTPVNDFEWKDLNAAGLTDMGKALSLVADAMKMPPMENRGLQPVLVLISDGQPTDDWRAGLKALMEQKWGQKAIRLGIAIGEDADVDVLSAFVQHSEYPVLRAKNADTLVNYIKWASTAVLKTASAPPSRATDPEERNDVVPVPIPPPPDVEPNSVDDIW